jgi:CMP-N,N'-diacetyllegionaminic acid synthase
MRTPVSMLAIIPARGGSQGLPGKNIRPLAGLPLIAHSIRLAEMCPEITRTIVSTDAPEIAQVARDFGAKVPFMRPAELAQDDTPMWSVLRHALQMADPDGGQYDFLLLLDPTSPGRLPKDICGAYRRLLSNPQADGIVGVSQPDFDPIWHCVVERDGWMTDLFVEARQYTRRQDVPLVYRINASLYIWRTSFVRSQETDWRYGKHLIYEIPEARAIHIDELHEFEKAELMIRHRLICLPWLDQVSG